jgi:hypothetical protein
MNVDDLADATLTHPESAWLALSTPIFLTIAGLLVLGLLLHSGLGTGLVVRITRLMTRAPSFPIEAALIWLPPVVSETQFLTICLACALIVLLALMKAMPLFLALLAAGPVTAGLIYLAQRILEGRYRNQLDKHLVAAVGRLGAQLRGGQGIHGALAKVVLPMSEGPLKREWQFIIDRMGVPLEGGSLATPQQVVAALAAQTPSSRHASFLQHLEVALGQTFDVLVRRVDAAYGALQHSEQRASQASTELSQMRYSGLAVGGAGLFMAAYLFFTQSARMARAYSGSLGMIAAVIVIAALISPLIAGVLLSQAEDMDY